jgi:hypothetical protein
MDMRRMQAHLAHHHDELTPDISTSMTIFEKMYQPDLYSSMDVDLSLAKREDFKLVDARLGSRWKWSSGVGWTHNEDGRMDSACVIFRPLPDADVRPKYEKIYMLVVQSVAIAVRNGSIDECTVNFRGTAMMNSKLVDITLPEWMKNMAKAEYRKMVAGGWII